MSNNSWCLLTEPDYVLLKSTLDSEWDKVSNSKYFGVSRVFNLAFDPFCNVQKAQMFIRRYLKSRGCTDIVVSRKHMSFTMLLLVEFINLKVEFTSPTKGMLLLLPESAIYE